MSEQLSNEKEKESGGSEEWWRQDKVDAVGWGVAFIWGALVLLAGTTNFTANYSWWDGWGVFFTGAAVITLIETVIRLQIPAYRGKWVGSLIWACILLAIGLGAWERAGWIWVLVLFAIGVIILREAFARKG
jgi:hypothetical protein